MTARVAVIGDIGGHADELRAELERLGVTHGGPLPPGLTVVQVGDLVHRGPASDEVVELVDRYLRTQPAQWIQLVGNHEAVYFRPPEFQWPERLGLRAARAVRRWWSEGRMHVAAVLTGEDESFLVTHAGVTAGFWRDVLGSPGSADDAARCVNWLGRSGADGVFRAGRMLHDGAAVAHAGPLWAHAADELVPGWIDAPMPFSQIHGHHGVVDWNDPTPSGGAGLGAPVLVDIDARHETVLVGGRRIIGIDPGHRSAPAGPWRALELTGNVSVPQ